MVCGIVCGIVYVLYVIVYGIASNKPYIVDNIMPYSTNLYKIPVLHRWPPYSSPQD